MRNGRLYYHFKNCDCFLKEIVAKCWNGGRIIEAEFPKFRLKVQTSSESSSTYGLFSRSGFNSAITIFQNNIIRDNLDIISTLEHEVFHYYDLSVLNNTYYAYRLDVTDHGVYTNKEQEYNAFAYQIYRNIINLKTVNYNHERFEYLNQYNKKRLDKLITTITQKLKHEIRN
jgi:hypothetical protein